MGSLQSFNNAVFNHPVLADYENACAVIAQHAAFDKVAVITDEVDRLLVYLRQANNEQLSTDDAKIRARSEREAGKLLVSLKEQGLLVAKGRPAKNNGYGAYPLSTPFTLDDLGLNKRLAARLRAYAKLSEAEFEEEAAQMEQQGKTVLPCAAEKPRKKAPVIEHKEAAVEAEFESSDAELLSTDETFQTLYEEEAAENAEKSERIEMLEAELAAANAKLAAYEENASQAISAETAQKIAALEAKVEALERDNKALTTQRDHFQSEFADRQRKLNWWKEEYKKVCKATGYERPKKTSTYCTGTGYSDPNDPRAKPLPPMEGTPQKDLAQQLAEEKAAANAQKKEANAWLEQNNLPADDGYQFNGKQATAQATRERFADNRPKAAPAEVKPKIPQSEWGKNALERPIVCREAQKLASIDKLNIIYYFKCLDAGLSEAAALNCAKLTSPNPLLARAGYDQ